MAKILVVDDSAVDQRVIRGLLGGDAELNIDIAAHGKEALAQLGGGLPDLIVTDLHMPEMDGFELLTEVVARYPLVPVIVVTSMGSEEIAVQALEKGAASYVPKRSLATHLLDTVTRVLAVSDQRRNRAQLLEGMERFEAAFELRNSSRLISPLVGYLQDNLMHMGLCGETDRIRIGVALQEALINALYHGNLEIPSDLRDEHPQRCSELIDERQRQAPYAERAVHVEARLSRSDATFVIRDEGPGFDISRVPDPTEPRNLNKVGGRGLLLMRAFMSVVKFNDTGNEVTLVKRLAAG